MESWLPINDFPKYEVSDKGNVRNAQTGKILHHGKNPKGYHIVSLYKNGGQYTKKVHRLVCSAFYGEPGSICSQTYICIGYDAKKHNFTKEQCLNIISYIKTRFFRYMVSLRKRTQDAFSQVYEFVPMQDFSEPWTDEKLYAKYGITPDEQAYIESLIKPME